MYNAPPPPTTTKSDILPVSIYLYYTTTSCIEVYVIYIQVLSINHTGHLNHTKIIIPQKYKKCSISYFYCIFHLKFLCGKAGSTKDVDQYGKGNDVLVDPKKREENHVYRDEKKAERSILRATVNARGEVSSLCE